MAGINNVGPGQEAIALYLTPEGMPTDSPKNITTRFQTPDVIEISYDPPPEEARNGQVGPNFENKFYSRKNIFPMRNSVNSMKETKERPKNSPRVPPTSPMKL